MTGVADRSGPWLALLGRLAASVPGAAVHGDVGEGFAGEGDVDLVAPAAALGDVEDAFRAWADEVGLRPVFSCRHREGALVLVALGAPGEPLWELEVRFERYFKGWTMWRAEDLGGWTSIGAAGYRRLRPGVAGLLKLVPNGLRAGGRPKWPPAKRARVAERLRADPEGVRAAAALLGPVRGAAERAAAAMARGEWDRRAAATVEAWALARGMAELPTLVRRVRARAGGTCELLATVSRHRGLVPGDPRAWAARVAADHRAGATG
jgi:hypothetical protein